MQPPASARGFGKLCVIRETLGLARQEQVLQIARVSTDLQRMAASIQQATGEAANAAEVGHKVLNNAETGAQSTRLAIGGREDVRQRVEETEATVRELRSHSEEIESIAKLITESTAVEVNLAFIAK